MPEDRVPVYVRLPREQAAALDRLVDATGRRKQQLVSDLLADRLAADTSDQGQLSVGRIEFIDDAVASDAVLTLGEAAELLRVPVDKLVAKATDGGLPGRSFGDGEWRFSRAALLAWLAAGDS